MVCPPTNKSAVTTAVLLAAGRGKRLRPHTDVTPKPLLPVNGSPTLDLYCKGCVEAGITRIVLVAHHLADQIISYSDKVPERFDLQCTTVIQQRLDGTASALEAARNTNAIQQTLEPAHSFLLMATDYLIPANFISDLLHFHASHDAAISISLKSVPEDELASRSSVRFAEDGSISEVVEKPPAGKAPSSLSANLAYVLPAALQEYLPQVKASARGEREIQTAINAYLAADGTARGLEQPAPNEWTPGIS